MSASVAIEKIITFFRKNNTEIINFKDSEYSTEELYKYLIKICGEIIANTAIDFLDRTDDDLICYLVINEKGNIMGIFIGYLDDEQLEAAYTCSTLKGAGELLGYYALLKEYSINPQIKTIFGFATGGIPALSDADSKEIYMEKNLRLVNYHKKRGARIDDSHDSGNVKFEYNVNDIIEKLTKSEGGKKKRKSRKSRRRRRRRKSRSDRRRSRRRRR